MLNKNCIGKKPFESKIFLHWLYSEEIKYICNAFNTVSFIDFIYATSIVGMFELFSVSAAIVYIVQLNIMRRLELNQIIKTV